MVGDVLANCLPDLCFSQFPVSGLNHMLKAVIIQKERETPTVYDYLKSLLLYLRKLFYWLKQCNTLINKTLCDHSSVTRHQDSTRINWGHATSIDWISISHLLFGCLLMYCFYWYLLHVYKPFIWWCFFALNRVWCSYKYLKKEAPKQIHRSGQMKQKLAIFVSNISMNNNGRL